VTDVGGPQELIEHGQTGYILRADDAHVWVTTILSVVDLIRREPERYREMRESARRSAHQDNSWEKVLEQVMGPKPSIARALPPRAGTPDGRTVAEVAT
jgi:phosphatidylinositol alpha 1,6-mannosyltransferase